MCVARFVITAIIVVFPFVFCSPIISHQDGHFRHEEYSVEHEISWSQARNSAVTIDLKSLPLTPSGCQICTDEEIDYCSGSDLINDHCCCDKRFSESLPFIPHTCYSGTTLCRTIAADCEEYYRRKTCCCDRHTLQIWKRKALKNAGNNFEFSQRIQIIFVILIKVFTHGC